MPDNEEKNPYVDYEYDLDFTGNQIEAQDETAPDSPVGEGAETDAASEVAVETSVEAGQEEGQADSEGVGEGTPEEVAPQEPAKPDLDDLEYLRRQLAEANMEILRLKKEQQPKSELPPLQVPQAQPAPQQTVPQTQTFPSGGEISNVDFFQGQPFEQFFENAQSFNKLLNTVATTVYNAAVMSAQEKILRQIPAVVETSANQQMQIRDIVGNFYATHKDLEPYKPAVSMAAIKLHNDNPGMALPELLNKAAEETRKFLRLSPGNPVRPRTPAKPAGSRGGGGVRPQQPTLSEQEQQILELLS